MIYVLSFAFWANFVVRFCYGIVLYALVILVFFDLTHFPNGFFFLSFCISQCHLPYLINFATFCHKKIQIVCSSFGEHNKNYFWKTNWDSSKYGDLVAAISIPVQIRHVLPHLLTSLGSYHRDHRAALRNQLGCS